VRKAVIGNFMRLSVHINREVTALEPDKIELEKDTVDFSKMCSLL